MTGLARPGEARQAMNINTTTEIIMTIETNIEARIAEGMDGVGLLLEGRV